MTPPCGLSRSAIKKKQIDADNGTIIKVSQSLRRDRNPMSQQQPIAMAAIRAHAAVGMRFSHAASVLRCEFTMSFMPVTNTPISGGGTAVMPERKTDQSSVCSCDVSTVLTDFCAV